MRQFEWSDLRFFLELVRAGNPASAARRLKADHTTVRRRVSALEDCLQTRLFASRGQTYVLTSDGERLLRYAEAVETMTVRAEEDVGRQDLSLSGAVRIGAPDGFGALFLAPRLQKLAELHPNLQVRLVVLPRVVNLANREADIAIAFSPPNQHRQIVRRLTDYRLRLYAAPSYLAECGPIETLADLTEKRFIGYLREMLYESELDILPAIDESVQASFESTSIIAQVQACAAGYGLCVLPDFIAEQNSQLQAVLPDQFELTRQFWMIIHPELVNLARVRAVIDFIAEQVRIERPLFLGENAVEPGKD